MPTDDTLNRQPWYFYVRNEAASQLIGIVGNDGAAVSDASLDIDVYFDGTEAEITDYDDVIYLPRKMHMAFAKMVAYDILQSKGIIRRDYKKEYDDALSEFKRKIMEDKEAPLRIRPVRFLP